MNIKQKKLFDSVLNRTPQDGWTARAFANGAKAAGVDAVAARRAFPRGIESVVETFNCNVDEAMHDAIARNRKFPALRVRDKVAFALRARLEFLH
ncbi:MAG: COQ9 family protein, partial [Alphaproteobacteria bacterium]|nr:COQ9 family protein [Alphaproteobacteria bacterium]